MPTNEHTPGDSKPTRPYDIGEFFKDMMVSEFVCGRSMLAVLAAPNPIIEPEDDLLCLSNDDSENDDSESSEKESIKTPVEDAPTPRPPPSPAIIEYEPSPVKVEKEPPKAVEPPPEPKLKPVVVQPVEYEE